MEKGTKIRAIQFRSDAGRPKRTKETLKALGLGRIGKQREFEANPALIGMLRRVDHLVRVEKV